MAVAATSAWAGFDEGKAAFDNGDYATAMAEWLPLAERDDAEARYHVGLLYRNGWGVLRDDTEAARWYRLAAYQGHLNAQFDLALMYEHGQGVTSDEIEAAKWYRLAAAQGYADAMRNLEFIVEERENQQPVRPHRLGGSEMTDSSTEWFGEAMHALLGLGNTMTISGVLLIALIVVVIIVPVAMPFSYFRIKPLMRQLSEEAAIRDQAMLGELRKMTAVAERAQAQTDEPRKMNRAPDAEVEP
ncbi:MAG: tetratricopeptide repeat protein [Alphaproteobacteria bacterium]